MVKWKRALAVGSALLLIPAVGAAEPPSDFLRTSDQPGDARGVACFDTADGYECFPNGDNVPQVDLLRVVGGIGEKVAVGFVLAGDPTDDDEFAYLGYSIGISDHPDADRGGSIAVSWFDGDVSTSVQPAGSASSEDEPACRDNEARRLSGADLQVVFTITADCLALIGSPDAIWIQAHTEASYGGDTIYGDAFDAEDEDGRPLPSGPVFSESVAERVDRIAGASRYDTAVQVSARQFPDGADTVYLARGVEPLVDALAGGMVTDGPVLLVPPGGPVPDVVAAEIERVDPDEVVALGGPSAVSDTVLRDAAGDRERGRISGETRYDTAIEVALRQFPDGADTVHLARGVGNLVDALAGGTLTDGPVLLVPPSGRVPDRVVEAVAAMDPDEVVALGGPLAISDEVLEAAADGRRTSRLAGESRYDTAISVARELFPDPTRIHLARAVDPLVDALAGGMVTAGPLILVPPTGDLPESVADYLGSLDDAVEVVVLGGSGAVEDRVLAHVVNAIGNAPR